jgi:hypothetical protein
MSKIQSVEIVDFMFDSPNKERKGAGQLVTYKRGASIPVVKNPSPYVLTTDVAGST